ncbi:Sporulation protein YlmC, PRC-barrel domain family [Noviherbaspirillum humi]|uniref:Sporulation protein YlmC, PRC-barrel domain family n=1 Tax=Noviherbaspirillum humi TaxID=1688639 RepID=A0A239KYZ3_9BURK|nr:PRC-barrel domain-containing protein [Noviherbaspirillum humi]SNT23255.1 Sporulation protein YlmC, PRC-barrel domain family [Noviherbaspirillum humi]
MSLSPRKNLVLPALLSALALAATAPSQAQTSAATPRPMTAPPAAPQAQQNAPDVRISKLKGRDVQDAKGKKIGDIEDLVVDMQREYVPYVVLSFGGALGLGDKLFAFPPNSFQSGKDNHLVLNVERDKLKNAPGFDKKKWPDFNDNATRGALNRYFQGQTTQAGSEVGQLWRASEMVGKNINERSGRNAGKIDDVVVNLGNGKVEYVVVAFDKAWSPDGKLVVLPLKAIDFPGRTDLDPIINIARDRIGEARSFEKNTWPDINSAAFKNDVRQYVASFDAAGSGRIQAGPTQGVSEKQPANASKVPSDPNSLAKMPAPGMQSSGNAPQGDAKAGGGNSGNAR